MSIQGGGIMKKFMLFQAALAVVCFQAAPALAVWSNDPGCGLGKMVWDGSAGQKHIIQQVLGSTTNGTFGSQTFGISFGTSGCTNDGVIVQNEQVNVFAQANFDNLAQEMAQGRGEHLASLATLLGVPAEQQPAFFAMTQEKYATFIRSGEPTPVAMLVALHEAMGAHPTLAKVVASR
jgi:endonuclease/exonuclease/phosphatase (EEP) superfamily protein YafD